MIRMARFGLASARWPLIALAVLFGSVSVAYGVIWMYHVRVQPTAFLGIDYEYLGPASGVQIVSVGRGTRAERAGIRAGDRIAAVDGQPVTSRALIYDAITRGTPGDRPLLTVIREGQPAPIMLQPTLVPVQVQSLTLPQRAVLEVIRAYPLLWLIVGLTVLSSASTIAMPGRWAADPRRPRQQDANRNRSRGACRIAGSPSLGRVASRFSRRVSGGERRPPAPHP